LKFAQVILPLALKELTYAIPLALSNAIKIGSRVEVQIGKKKVYSAIVSEIHDREPLEYKVKPITNVLDENSLVTPVQIQFWRWIADYYMSTTGEILMEALPSGLKLKSETKIVLHSDFNHDYNNLSAEEFTITEALSNSEALSIDDIKLILQNHSFSKKKISDTQVFMLLEEMMTKQIVFIEEDLIEKYKPRTETFISIHPRLVNNEMLLQQVFQDLEKRAVKQSNTLLSYFMMIKKEEQVVESDELIWVNQTELIKKSTGNSSVINALIDKEILQSKKMEVSRLKFKGGNNNTYQFTNAQQLAFENLEKQLQQKEVVLLHGETGSGKTLLYVELIKQAISKGEQVLFLLPEITLTEHLITKLKHWLGEEIAVYHSRYNDNQRVEIWNAVMQKKYKVVVGARSAIFLPFTNLGLIIVDEEHDASFKQSQRQPHYHARDAAIYLAHIFKAKTILGSATPSLETWQNAYQQKYGLVKLKEKFGGNHLLKSTNSSAIGEETKGEVNKKKEFEKMMEDENKSSTKIELIDLREANRMKTMKGSFSWKLFKAIQKTVADKKQVLLFQNRRGYSPSLYCGVCGWIPECNNCSVKLTYHKYSDSLSCHYCNFTRRVIQSCPRCGESNMKIQGVGTEKVEDELKILLPELRIARMDADTVRGNDGHQRMMDKFEKGEIDVLVGTQMITKGLDFENIGLVGVLSADALMSFPDFRVNERTYQTLHQVSGRTGRKNNNGAVMIQALNIKNSTLQWFLRQDIDAFYDEELKFRQTLLYPPFARLIHVEIKHRKVETAVAAANWLHQKLLPALGKFVLGPSVPAIDRVKNYYRRELLIKINRNQTGLKETKALLRQCLAEMPTVKGFGQVVADVDVDC
jgi:primosomal protein N' (replication factor Y) (superfamily II helicase)